ncbi:MAG: hypothetical protein MJ050_06405 [Phascolarctobacterium sp.]|nr:hypothetical protein [Phascolarctobacterium sp.]
MVFNKKRVAEEKQLKAKIELEQRNILAWLEEFLPEYNLAMTLPSVKISYDQRTKRFGHYALDNIEQSRLIALEKYDQGKICAEELKQRQLELAEKAKQIVIVEPMHAAYLSNNTIVYYINNIQITATKKNYALDEFLTRIVAHEMFHAIHCFLCGTEHWTDNNCPREWNATVKESLARYVEYVFSIEKTLTAQSRDIKLDLQDSHKCAPSYPYAGAKKLILDKRNSFREIFTLSLENWQTAYKHLMK